MVNTIHRWPAAPGMLAAPFYLALIVVLGALEPGFSHLTKPMSMLGGCKNILTEPDLVGRLHIVFSLLGGMGTALAPFFVWSAMRGNDNWKGLATPTLVTAILANLPGITFWITIATGFRLPSIEGLIQRLGFVIVLVWIFFVAARLWRLTYPGSHSVGASG